MCTCTCGTVCPAVLPSWMAIVRASTPARRQRDHVRIIGFYSPTSTPEYTVVPLDDPRNGVHGGEELLDLVWLEVREARRDALGADEDVALDDGAQVDRSKDGLRRVEELRSGQAKGTELGHGNQASAEGVVQPKMIVTL